MRTPKVIKLLVILTGFTTLAIPCCYGQSDVDPDHFDSPTEPSPQTTSKEVRFDGQVNLPYTLICAGKKLLPGRYAVSLRSDGKTGLVILNQKGQIIEVAGIVRLPAGPRAANALLVECVGKAHRLSAVHVKEMELVFDSRLEVQRTPDDKLRRTEKLLLTRMSSQK